MTILIAYATNSGSTYLVAKHLSDQLKKKNLDNTLINVIELGVDDVLKYDLVFFGSNSWDFERKEGQPHHAFIQFLDQAKSVNWQGKKFAMFGCGDKTYMRFCGALDILSEFIESHDGNLVSKPLKIDRFYFNDQDETFKQVDAWLEGINLNL